MPLITMKCDELIPERGKHTYITDIENPVIPRCNVNTIPGDMTERGCSFAGARGVVGGPVVDVIHMVHSPVGCAYYTWGSRRSLSDWYAWSGPNKLDNASFNRRYCVTTDMEEKDVVFGGGNKLKKACLEAFQIFPEAKGLFMYSTCTSGLIGDDIPAVAKQVEKTVGKPVFFAQAPGCSGVSQSKGHHVFNHEFYRQVRVLREKQPELCMQEEEKTLYDINLIGDYNMDWDLKAIIPLFEQMGIRIVATFTGNERLANLIKMPDAKLNLVHCQRSAGYIAELIKDHVGVDSIPVTLYGLEETSKALRDTGKYFGLEKRAEEIIARETARVKDSIAYYRSKLVGKRVALYVGAPRVWHWINLMEELGMEIVAMACTFAHKDDYEKINARAKSNILVIDNPNEFEVEEMLHDYKPDLFLCGLKEKYIARKMGVSTVNSHSYEKGPYAGYFGFVNFARDIYQGFYAPVWKFVKNNPFEEVE